MNTLVCLWDGEHMVPLPRYRADCDKEFVVGHKYHLGVIHERSTASHRHYFAAVHEAWQNLTDEAIERFPTSEHLRKWALIRAGWRDERSLLANNKEEAERFARFIRPSEPFSVIMVNDNCITVYTARSQSYRAMKKEDFEASKNDVLEIVARMAGTTREELELHAANSDVPARMAG